MMRHALTKIEVFNLSLSQTHDNGDTREAEGKAGWLVAA